MKRNKLQNLLWIENWEKVSIGTAPSYKIHSIGTVPTDEMHPVGNVLTDKMHPVGTLDCSISWCWIYIVYLKQVGPTPESNSNFMCIFGQKRFWVKKMLGTKNFGSKTIWVQINFGSKNSS